MNVTLIGLGCGDLGTMTAQAKGALAQAEAVLGAKRLLATLPETSAPQFAAVKPEDIRDRLQEGAWSRACVVFSGDTGFYSGAKKLIPLLETAGMTVEVLPGVSSLQAFAAKLKTSWQDWRLCSGHGVEIDPVAEVCHGQDVFFLTGGVTTPAQLCRQLTAAGLGHLQVAVGESLSYPQERIRRGKAADLAQEDFEPLSVMVVQAPPPPQRRMPGIPDEDFLRGKVPMTKQEVRAAILAKLAPRPEEICWDIGAGTGSVSVELALHSRAVWAVEHKAEACGLIRENRERFSAWNLRLAEGSAPEVLGDLPTPDVVFIGGSGGKLPEILALVARRAPRARICISAIALETLHSGAQGLRDLGYATEITQIAVSRTKEVGELHLLLAQNPVFLILGERP